MCLVAFLLSAVSSWLHNRGVSRSFQRIAVVLRSAWPLEDVEWAARSSLFFLARFGDIENEPQCGVVGWGLAVLTPSSRASFSFIGRVFSQMAVVNHS